MKFNYFFCLLNILLFKTHKTEVSYSNKLVVSIVVGVILDEFLFRYYMNFHPTGYRKLKTDLEFKLH